MTKHTRIKVVLAGRDVNGTGGGRVLIETALGLAARNCEVIVVSDTSIPELAGRVRVEKMWFGDALKRWQVRHKASRILRHTLQMLCFMMFGTRAAANLRKRGFLVVNHNIEILLGDVVVLHNVFSAQAVVESRSVLWRRLRFLNPVFTMRIVREKWLLGRRDGCAIVAVSRPTLEEAAGLIKGEHQRLVIQNGVDTRRFTRAAESGDAETYGADGEVPLLFVGHEFERKGLRYLIEALARLPGSVVLWVAGGRGSSVDEYRELACALEVSDRVRFLGTVSDPGELYRNCFAFVLPTAYEALPLVVLEAMACAKPVLVTAVGGIVDVIDDGGNGLVITRDAGDIANKVTLLMNDGRLRSVVSAAAVRTANDHTWDRVSGEYYKLIASIAAQKCSPIA